MTAVKRSRRRIKCHKDNLIICNLLHELHLLGQFKLFSCWTENQSVIEFNISWFFCGTILRARNKNSESRLSKLPTFSTRAPRTFRIANYWAIVSFPEILLTFLVTRVLQSSLRVFQTVNFIFQIVAQQVLESIRQFCQFISRFCFCGRKFVAGSGIPKGPKFSVHSHKLSPQRSRFVADWTDWLFLFWKYFSHFIVQK